MEMFSNIEIYNIVFKNILYLIATSSPIFNNHPLSHPTIHPHPSHYTPYMQYIVIVITDECFYKISSNLLSRYFN